MQQTLVDSTSIHFTNFRCYWYKFDPTLHGLPISKIARLKVLHYLSRFAFIFLTATLACNIFLRTSWQLEYS